MAIGKKTASASASSAPALVSMSPENFTFGLIDDVDVEFTDAACATASSVPEYTVDDPDTPLFIVEMTDVNGTSHNQFYSLGKSDDWQPSAAGDGFVSVSGKSTINATSNLGMFIKSLVESGFPTEILASGNLKSITGTKCHVLMKQTDRKTIVRVGKNADRPSGVLLVSKIHALPGADTATKGKSSPAAATKAAAGGKANGAAATTPSAATTASGDSDAVDTELVPAVMAALAENDGQLMKKDLIKIANDTFNTPELKSLRNKAIGRANQPAFMAKLQESGVNVDGAKLSLSE